MTIIDLLTRHEGLRLKPYKDTVGKLTIGVGRNLDDIGITREEANMMLIHDIARVEQELNECLPWWASLDPVRQAVLVDLGFNLGVKTGNPPKLLTFKTTLGLIEAGLQDPRKFTEAAANLKRTLWHTQVGNRAERLELMLETGRWPGEEGS
jgi:lysozyme